MANLKLAMLFGALYKFPKKDIILILEIQMNIHDKNPATIRHWIKLLSLGKLLILNSGKKKDR